MIYVLVIVILLGAWVSGYFFGYYQGGRAVKERELESQPAVAERELICSHERHASYRDGVAECMDCGELLVDPDAG